MKPLLILQHFWCETPGIFQEILDHRSVPHVILRPYAGEEFPAGLDPYSGLLLMGGPMGVHDGARYPWLREEDRLLRQALDRKIPVLGVCLGSQLLAKAAGARVSPGPRKEIGWYPIELTPEGAADPLFRHLPPRFETFEWHGDVFELPPGAVSLASSAQYPHQAFRLGARAYGLLFHLEVTEEMVRRFCSLFSAEVEEVRAYISPPSIQAHLSERVSRLRLLVRPFFEGFCGMIEEPPPGKPTAKRH